MPNSTLDPKFYKPLITAYRTCPHNTNYPYLYTTKQPNNKKQQCAKNCYHQLKNKIALFESHI